MLENTWRRSRPDGPVYLDSDQFRASRGPNDTYIILPGRGQSAEDFVSALEEIMTVDRTPRDGEFRNPILQIGPINVLVERRIVDPENFDFARIVAGHDRVYDLRVIVDEYVVSHSPSQVAMPQ
jgi:hypothetical protein